MGKEECENCGDMFTLGINGGTIQMEDGKEFMLCDKCKGNICEDCKKKLLK